MKYKNVLIDGNCIAIRIFTSLPTFSKAWIGTNQEAVFAANFLTSLYKILSRIRFTDNIWIFWDSKISLRKRIYPAYKANRIKKDKETWDNYYNILNGFKSKLRLLGDWCLLEAEGYEADDLIADVALTPDIYKSIVVSSDNDLYQLLHRVDLYLPHKHKIYTIEDFMNEYNITPDKWAKVKAIAGDRKDNISGLDGIGIRKAIKLLEEKDWDDLVKSSNDIETNYKLLKLPLKHYIFTYLPDTVFMAANWIEFFQAYSLSKFNLHDFEKLFG